MSDDGGRQIDERVDVLQLARASHGEQTLHGAFSVVTAIAEHDFAPLDGRPERALGGIVRRRHAGLVDECEEVLMVNEERPREIPRVCVGGVDVPLRERKELLLERERLGDQRLARQRGATHVGIIAEAVPEVEEPPLEPERVAAEPFGGGGGRQFLRAE